MKPNATSLAIATLLALTSPGARAAGWDPGPGHTQVAIWPGTPPDNWPVVAPESANPSAHVTRPTYTVYAPRGKNTGAAVVVFPGGGYMVLAMDLEGTEICDWLTSRGITAVLLKYRVPGNEHYPPSAPHWRSGPYPRAPLALEDAQRTLGLVRFHAKALHIDPHKIGVIGFSAGGHLVAATCNHFTRRIYRPVDLADRVSCRPDFGIALYPGHLWDGPTPFKLVPDIRPTKQTPPQLIFQAENDPVDNIQNSLAYYAGLKKAGVPVEMHLYADGKHAFGLRPSRFPISTAWPGLTEAWLRTIDVLAKQ